MPAFSLAGVVVAVTGALRFRDPHGRGSWGYCPTAYFTDYACPLCGCLRAVNDLAHGNLLAATSSNALFVAVMPLLVIWWVTTLRDRWNNSPRDWRWPLRHRMAWPVITVVALTFTLLRNLPAGQWLMP